MKTTKKLKQLSVKEMKNTEGGDWIYNLGAGLHRGWCALKEVVNDSVADSTFNSQQRLGHVGGGRP